MRVAWLVVGVMVGACGGPQHVELAPMPTNLAPAQRVEVFNRLRRAGEIRTVTTSCGNYGCRTSTSTSMVMANGTVIDLAEDLLPLVPRDSATGRAATSAGEAHDRASWWGKAAWLTGTVGFGVLMYGFYKVNTPEEIIGGTLFGAGVAAGIVWAVSYYDAKLDTRAAFDHFTPDLANELALCVSGLSIVPCEAPPSAPAPAIPDPNLGSLRQQ